MPLPLSLWYALRTGHIARGVTAAGETVRVQGRSGPDGRTGYAVATGALKAARSTAGASTRTAPDTHGAVFHGDGPLCDFLYTVGLDPRRLAVRRRPGEPGPTRQSAPRQIPPPHTPAP